MITRDDNTRVTVSPRVVTFYAVSGVLTGDCGYGCGGGGTGCRVRERAAAAAAAVVMHLYGGGGTNVHDDCARTTLYGCIGSGRPGLNRFLRGGHTDWCTGYLPSRGVL